MPLSFFIQCPSAVGQRQTRLDPHKPHRRFFDFLSKSEADMALF